MWSRIAPRLDAGRGLKPYCGRVDRDSWEIAPRLDAGRGLKQVVVTKEVAFVIDRPASRRGARIETVDVLIYEQIGKIAPRLDAGRGLKHTK